MTLEEFTDQTKEAQALKRAIAVKMKEEGYATETIEEILGVKKSFIYKWRNRYFDNDKDASCLALGYNGSEGYLSQSEREEVIEFLKEQDYYSVQELHDHLKEQYEVEYESAQSYYALLNEGGLSWKKTQKSNPGYNPEAAQERIEEIKKNWSRDRKK